MEKSPQFDFGFFRKDWMQAIQHVADKIYEDETASEGSCEVPKSGDAAVDELSAKFSLTGTSATKSSGKKKVVSSLFC